MNASRSIPGAACLLALAVAAHAATCNVRDYGAKADRTTNDAPAIQAAMDACAREGGGEVVVPSGNYLIGHLDLRSNVTLDLQNGATLWASSRWEDYEKSAHGKLDTYLISGDRVENIGLVGQGEIHGRGQPDLGRKTDKISEDLVRTLPHRYGTIQLNDCRNVHIRDLTIRYSERFTIDLNRCERVFIDGVSILNNYWRANTDGIDPSSCKDVFISNCFILAGDDCICPKTSGGIPLENLVVTNCVLQTSASAIKLGTTTNGDFRDIKVSNCVIRNTDVGIGLFMKDGGTAERLSFENISIETITPQTPINPLFRNSSIPIYIDIEQRTPQSRISGVRDISFSDIQVTSDNSAVLQGMSQSPIRNLTLRNITFRVPDGFDFSHRQKHAGGTSNPKDDRITKYVRKPTYIALANVEGLDVDDVRVLVLGEVARRFDRSALGLYDCRDGVVADVERRPADVAGSQPVVALEDCQDVRVGPASQGR